MKRCCAIDLGGIHIGLLLQQSGQARLVSLHDGVGNITPPGAQAEPGNTQQQQSRTGNNCASSHLRVSPQSLASLPVLSPWLFWLIPYMSRMLNRRFAVVMVLR